MTWMTKTRHVIAMWLVAFAVRILPDNEEDQCFANTLEAVVILWTEGEYGKQARRIKLHERSQGRPV